LTLFDGIQEYYNHLLASIKVRFFGNLFLKHREIVIVAQTGFQLPEILLVKGQRVAADLPNQPHMIPVILDALSPVMEILG
jgi:hypothetical protein